MKIPVTILTYRRPAYLSETIETFLEKNGTDRFQFLILSQNPDEETAKILNKHIRLWKKCYVSTQNKGCAAGYSFIMRKALKLGEPFVIHLQDDWRSDESLLPYLDEMIELMKEKRNIGYIRLRRIGDHVSAKNRITHKFIFYRWVAEHILAGNAHFTLNPTFARADVISRMLPITKELHAMNKYHYLCLLTGQLVAKCFTHIGVARATTGEGKAKRWVK